MSLPRYYLQTDPALLYPRMLQSLYHGIAAVT